MNIIPDDMLLVQTNLVANQPLTAILSVALVYHFQQFNHCHHDKLNVFAVQHKLDCVAGTLTPVLLDSHRASSDSVHVSALDYESLPFLMLRTCDRIASWWLLCFAELRNPSYRQICSVFLCTRVCGR
jgi:hypothetical protein